MNYTKEQIEKMADEYANQFIDGKDHFYGFKAGFEKALSLFAVSRRSELLSAFSWVSSIGEQFFDSSKTVDDMVDIYQKSR